MKKVPLILAILLSVFTFSQEKFVKVTSKLESVKVNFSNAYLTHLFTATIPEGESLIFVENISNQIDVSQIELDNDKDVKIIDVKRFRDDRTYTTEQLYKTTFTKLNDSINMNQIEISKIIREQAINSNSIEILKKNQELNSKNESEILQLIAFNKRELKLLYAEEEELKLKLQNYTEKNKEFKYQMDVILQENNKLNMIAIKVYSNKKVNANFEAKYNAPGNWRPYYQLKSSGTESPLKIFYKAHITNSTGIIWENTRITLISGDFQNISKPYELNRLFLQTQKETYTSNQAFQQERQNSNVQEMRMADSSEESVQQKTLNTQIELDKGTIILSADNNRPSIIDIATYKIDTEYKYFSTPKLDSKVFLLAYIQDYSKYNLLPGSADIFLDDIKVGQANIAPNQISERMLISLGEDPNVLIKRTLINKNTIQNKDNRMKTETYKYEIAIKNNKNRKINLEIKNQIPLSSDSSVKIEMMPNNDNAKLENSSGIITWELELKANETRKVNFGFNITLPENLSSVNIN